MKKALIGTNEWYAGVPFQGTRELTLEERYELQSQQRRLFWTGCLALLLAPFALVGLLLVLTFAEFLPLATWIQVLFMFALLILTVGLLLTGRAKYAYSRKLKADLRAGYLKKYTTLQENNEPYELEVLPPSNRLWRVNEEMVYDWISHTPVWVAEVPEIAHVAAEWVSPAENAPQDEPHFNWRALSEAEKLEISRLANKLVLKLLPITLFFTAWLLLLAFTAFRSGGVPADIISFLVLIVITLAINWQFIIRCLQASRLRRDRDAGQVVILRWLRQEEDAEANRESTLTPPVEVLPRTRFVWTEDGKPAAWRLVK